MAENISEEAVINDAKSKLKALQDALSKIETRKSRGVNIFDAVGMTTQEIKHSAFLAWLMKPTMPHGFQTKFLKALLENVLRYERDGIDIEGYLTNRQILSVYGIHTIDDLQELLSDEKLSVLTERSLTLDGDDGRIDIFIESEKAKTLIAIENKVFTSTHDDQLNRYVAEFENRSDWKKVFIYLTPNGDLPYGMDNNYDARWCVLSYETVLDTVRTVLSDVHNTKLKNLMGDYIEMVDTNILKNNPELKDICKKIMREHKDAIEILRGYTDSAEEVIKNCVKWIELNFPNATIVMQTTRRLRFYTANMENYFGDETINLTNGGYKILYSFSCDDGPFTCGAFMEKSQEGEWTAKQVKIAQNTKPNKKFPTKYFSIFSQIILSVEERETSFGEIEETLKKGLQNFKQQIEAFEGKLLNAQ